MDDCAEVLRGLHRVLAYAGHVVTTAASAEAAIAMLDAQQFDVVVTDLDMPGAGGIWLLGKIRSYQPNAMRILSSGSAADLAEHVNSGLVQCVLAKPVHPDDLRRVLARR